MALVKSQLEKLRKVVRLHINWFVASILGDDALTADERAELDKFKKLPKQPLSLIDKAFILGRLKAIFKKAEWKNLSWEDFLELTEKQSLSPLEKLVLQQAKLSAAQHVKGLADDIAAGIFDKLAQATNQAISEASIKELIRDQVQIAILEQKSYKELASSLASTTKTEYSKRWERVSRTELHAAKTAGISQAIINKVDVYKNSQGIHSMVSIVPHPGTCLDCEKHYLDSNGNPKVFPLSTLMGAGSNADASHTKTHGVHTQWKTTLPPLHPNCRCELLFIPPGYSWVNGKLKLTDKAALSKAIGDSSLSATMKPAGPPSAAATAPAQPASIPGVKSPGQATPAPSAGGGKGTSGPAGVKVDYVSKEDSPERPKNAIGDTEHSWKVIPGASSDKPLTPEQEQAKRSEEITQAKEWGKQDHPHAKVLDHLNQGEIVDRTEVGEGINGAIRTTIAGNGRGLLKHGFEANEETKKHKDSGDGFSQGWQSVPHDTYAHREKAAYSMAMALGMPHMVPPTTVINDGGHEKSHQAWNEHMQPFHSACRNVSEYLTLDDMMTGKYDEKLEKAGELIGFQLACGATDAHLGNVLVNKDTGDLQSIDMGSSFCNGMDGTHSSMLKMLGMTHHKVKVPQSLTDKFDKMSVGDIQRAMGSKFSDWEVGQQFMRQQYISHLMKTEGHLDHNKFRCIAGNGTGEVRFELGYGGSPVDGLKRHQKEKELGRDPQTLFEGFCKAWLDKAKSDPSHPHHESAKQLDQIGIFMPPEGTAKDPKGVRAAGLHREHEKTVKAAWPEEVFPAKDSSRLLQDTDQRIASDSLNSIRQQRSAPAPSDVAREKTQQLSSNDKIEEDKTVKKRGSNKPTTPNIGEDKTVKKQEVSGGTSDKTIQLEDDKTRKPTRKKSLLFVSDLKKSFPGC